MATEVDVSAKHSKDEPTQKAAESRRPRAARRYRSRVQDREQRYRTYGQGYSDVVHDFSRLAYALSRASTRAYFSTARVIGDLVLNLTDSVYDSFEVAEPYDSEATDNTDRELRDSRRPRDRYRYSSEQLSDDVSANLSDAIHDVADVLAESADEFDAVHDDASGAEARQPTRDRHAKGTRGKSRSEADRGESTV